MRLSVSATDEEWTAVRERAAGHGLSISDFLVGLALPAGSASGAGPLPALDGVEQREALDAIRYMRGFMLAMDARNAAPPEVRDRIAAPHGSPDTGAAGLSSPQKAGCTSLPGGRRAERTEGARNPPMRPGHRKHRAGPGAGRKTTGSRDGVDCSEPGMVVPVLEGRADTWWCEQMLKRAHRGTSHKLSPKHLHRYIDEFAGKHNIRDSVTFAQMRDTVLRRACRLPGPQLPDAAWSALCNASDSFPSSGSPVAA